MGNKEGIVTEAKELTIKDKIAEIDRLSSYLVSKEGYCIDSFEDNSAPEKNPSKSDMDHDLDLIIDRLKDLSANLYLGPEY